MSESLSLQAGLDALASAGVSLAADAHRRLAQYLALLDKWNGTYNLTAIRDPQRMVTHHVLDALAVLPHLGDAAALRLLDVGSGAGIPGIPIALARPEYRVALLDSSHKKGAFMQQALAELGVSNAQVHICRIEDFAPGEPYDIVISRAFSDLASFAECSVRLLAPGGRLVAMKGVFPHEEIEQLPASVRLLDTPAVSVPGLDAERHLVLLEAA